MTQHTGTSRTQGLIEYFAIAGLIALFMFSAIRHFGIPLQTAIHGATHQLSGHLGSGSKPSSSATKAPSGSSSATKAPSGSSSAANNPAGGATSSPSTPPSAGNVASGTLPADALPPGSPAPVRPTTGHFTLTWNPSTTNTQGAPAQAAGYQLYIGLRSGDYGKPIKIPGGSTTTFKLSGLERGRRYYFAVTAYAANGLESAKSKEVSKTVP